MSQEIHDRFAVDGILYVSRLTAAECIAVYDRAVVAKLKATRAIDLVRLAGLVPSLAALGVVLIDDR
ncbi:hypothetical protein DFR50_14456 [Roseiarcus fermentans]|uniref:RES domain-containing protein n=1 Tax=Roseiarcus fermentans TaxID=1473586 RepID=A0A366EP94_9HYPH|nr:hypothetical protein [Roseiarcus fermentans]RBP03500.1 hypothetical protein DFR50_14456 [Roseiarcus fermentans]